MDTLHNPDRYMIDLRQILSQGRKRIGLLVGAGAPASILVDAHGKIDASGTSLIPDVSGLTKHVINSLESDDAKIFQEITKQVGSTENIEAILTQIRRLAEAIGPAKVHGLDGAGFRSLGERICKLIGDRVGKELPQGETAWPAPGLDDTDLSESGPALELHRA